MPRSEAPELLRGKAVTATESGLLVATNKLKPVRVYDTTLRDGQQGIDVNYSVRGKLRVARAITRHLPVALIEGGWPGANGVDTEFFQKAQDEEFHPMLTAFGMTRRAGEHVEGDTTIVNLLASGADHITIVGKSDTLHVHKVFKTTLEENLAMIEDSVRYVKEQGKDVIYDAEHFFDGYNRNPDYAMETLKAAARGGASSVVLCDTNGGRLPKQIDEIVRTVVNDADLHQLYREANNITDPEAKIEVGIHTHADRRFAEANSLVAVEAGATHVQGTIAGLGERAGNADLLSIMDALAEEGFITLDPDQRAKYMEVGKTVFEASGADMDPNLPFIGLYAFASKAGMHQDAMFKDPHLYNHRLPEEYGNQMLIVLNSQSGKRAVAEIAKQQRLNVPAAEIPTVTAEIKDKEHQGYRYTRAIASLELLMRRHTPEYQAPFSMQISEDASQVTVTIPPSDGATEPRTITLQVPEGDKRKSAHFNELREALAPIYPELDNVSVERLSIEAENGTRRVYIKSTNENLPWITVGVSNGENAIAKASWEASAEALEYALYHPHVEESVAA